MITSPQEIDDPTSGKAIELNTNVFKAIKDLCLEKTLDPNQQTHRVGKSKFHFRLSYEHEGENYSLYKREDSLIALYAIVIYSMNLTRWHLQQLDQTSIPSEYRWTSIGGECLKLQQSIWSQNEHMLYEDWPMLTGRVRYLFNISPYHYNNRPFDYPLRLLLGEDFDVDGTVVKEPIEYYFEIQGSAEEKISQLVNLCSKLNVKLERLEYYPTIHFTRFNFNEKYTIELNPHEEFVTLLELIIQRGIYPKDSKNSAIDEFEKKETQSDQNIEEETTPVTKSQSHNSGWYYRGHENKYSNVRSI